MKKLYTSKHFLKRLVGGGIPLISYPTRSAPGHKLQKPLKESGIFQSLGTINFVNFLLKGKVKRRGEDGTTPPLIRC